ncbi:hypothetical protein BDV93DRAFT_518714 [Ceratobasidium sp. AG-I]|nr:hypothetical protein BDV93DRAFT_518714 [Ceratobasidium sp. AG-I]
MNATSTTPSSRTLGVFNTDMLQPYSEIDFKSLSEFFPPLKPYLFRNKQGGYTLDFKDDATNRTLTRALLKRDFGLELTLLDDRLCPPVRADLSWILTNANPIHCSTAIYPMIACSIHNTWSFLATDIDEQSLSAAAANIKANPAIAERVQLLPATHDGPILFPLFPENHARTGVESGSRRPYVTFSMCNPPFYSNVEDIARSAGSKEFEPHAVCTGALVEMVTSGGEVNFVQRMLEESLILRDICGWYTSLLGKMSSLVALVTIIKEKAIDNYAITELVQGNTRRWVIAWSFLDIRLPDALARPSSQSLRSIAPPPNNLRHTLSAPNSPPLSYPTLLHILADIPRLRINELEDPQRIQVIAREVTWTRAARRLHARNATAAVMDSSLAPIMVSEITVVDSRALEVRWVRGRDRGIFESFWGHLSGRLN